MKSEGHVRCMLEIAKNNLAARQTLHAPETEVMRRMGYIAALEAVLSNGEGLNAAPPRYGFMEVEGL